MNSLYLIVTFAEFFLCFVSSSYSSRQDERITTTEIRLDAVMRDIAVYRLDIIQIWEHLNQLNTSGIKNCDCSSPNEFLVESDQERRIFLAFKREKQAVRNILRRIGKNVTNVQKQAQEDIKALEQSHTDVKIKLKEKVSEIEKCSKDLKSLDSYTKSALIKQEERIESLETEVNRYKTVSETRNEELIDIKTKLSEMVVFNEKVLNNLYKLTDCSSEWHKYSGSCYYFSTSTSNWTEANENRQKEGAHLVEYDGIGEVKFVLDLVLTIEKAWSTAKWAGFWAGGSDLNKEGDWVWNSTRKNMDTGFVNWYRPQPDNYRGTEHCLMSCINLEGQWNDAYCPSKQRYVCEKTLLL